LCVNQLKLKKQNQTANDINLPYWPARAQSVALVSDGAALLLRGQIHQGQLHHAQKVVACQAILVKHLKDKLMLRRFNLVNWEENNQLGGGPTT